MALSWTAWRRAGLWCGLAGLFTAAALIGCGSSTSPKPANGDKPQANSSTGTPVTSPKVTIPAGSAALVPLDPALHQPFAKAVIEGEPPDEEEKLPESGTTMTGKSVGKLHLEVKKLWSGIHFSTPEGKPLTCRAILDTELDEIEILLRPDLAPNHVRSFVALARSGYFDGLVFERTVRQEPDSKAGDPLEYIEGGCPLGTGEEHHGSIGYWLLPELDRPVQHEEGTVGACHGQALETAACKFYITLTRAPVMDGNYTVFGKVVRGLDVARAIRARPVRAEYPHDCPVQPVVIRKVTIHTTEAAGPSK
jgi:cyclophilin family peptidyl-prolyl cis-trans isomerase